MKEETASERRAAPGLSAYAIKVIRLQARYLVGKGGYREGDREDLEQELVLDLLQNLKHYNPDKAKEETFVSHVVCNKVAELLRRRRAQLKHPWNRPISIETPVGADEDGSYRLADVIADPAHGQDDLRRDVAHLLSTLPPQLRELCERLKTQGWAQATREMGIAEKELPALRRKLRAIFENAGLAPSSPDNGTAPGSKE